MATHLEERPEQTKQDPQDSQNRAPLAIGAIAVISALLGLVIVVQMVLGSDPAVAVNTEARQGDISVWVDRYQWLVHDHSAHDHSEDANDPTSPAQNELPAVSGFPMSAAMMPGTPDEGFHRLQIDLSIVNRGEGTLEMKPADFRLVSEDGDEWPSLRGGTFSPTDLSGGYMLGTVLAFDVPEEFSSTGMYLEWTWEGEVTRFAFNGSGHDH